MAEDVRTSEIPERFHSPHTHAMLMMAAALGLKDRYTQGHGQRVAVYSGRLAECLGLSTREIQQITMGGLLHDIGKLALSDRIFSHCKASLTRHMQWEVRNHPVNGAKLLRRFNCSATICDMVLCHHERLDGSGYPKGLAGDDIPLGARIVGVVDCFDAITTDRPYQRHKTRKEAFEDLAEMAGNALQADLVTAFIREIRRNGMLPPDQFDPCHASMDFPMAAAAR
ncbi:MAG: HD domain-containing phosphohydrolase [Desulfosarcinaceae bacterium]